MPAYDYRCPSCGERFEVQRSLADFDLPTSCPNGHPGATRVITSWGVSGGVRYGSPATAGRKGRRASSVTDPKPTDQGTPPS